MSGGAREPWSGSRWWRQWLWVTVCLAGLAASLSASRLSWRLDQALYDLSLTLFERPAPSDIVLIRIDDESIKALGRWPWPRAVHATLLEQITPAQPKSILLNLLLSEPSSDPNQDHVLAQAMTRSGRVVLPVSPIALSAGQVEWVEQAGMSVLLPLPVFRAAATLGHADVPMDADGVVRHIHLRAGAGLPTFPHLAEAMMGRAGERLPLAIDTLKAPGQDALGPSWMRDDQLLLRYGGPKDWIPSVSYAAVLRGDVPPSAFRDKHVLIGVTAMGLGTHFTTSVSSLHGTLSGVEVTAQALRMLRDGDTIAATSAGLAATLSALGVVCVMWGISRLPPRQGLILSMLTASGSALLSMAVLGWAGQWWPPGAFMLTTALAYPLWSWRRLELSQQSMKLTTQAINQQLPGEAEHLARPPRSGDAMARSLSDAMGATERLQQYRRHLEELLTALPVAVFVIDHRLNIEACNPLALALLNRSTAHSVQGRPLASLMHGFKPMEATNWVSMLTQAIQSPQGIMGEIEGPDHTVLWARMVPYREAHQSDTGLMISLTDVSKLRLAERQRDELLSFIAHDIRSPQASLVSLVEMHRLGYQTLPLDVLMTHVDTLAHSTIDLCEELLMVMKSETQPLHLMALDPIDVAQQAIAETGPTAQAKGVVLTLQSMPWRGEAPQADAVQWRRALINLLTNAIKFSPPGGEVTIGIDQDEAGLRMWVQDQGPGIDEGDLARLFRRYQRLDSDPQLRMAAGVGLGLVYVDTVTRRHGGQVEVQSTRGQGSRFTMTLPQHGPTPTA